MKGCKALGFSFASTLFSKKVKGASSRRAKATFFGAMVLSSSALSVTNAASAYFTDLLKFVASPVIGALSFLKFTLPLATEFYKTYFLYQMYCKPYIPNLLPKQNCEEMTVSEFKRIFKELSNLVVGQKKVMQVVFNVLLKRTYHLIEKQAETYVLFFAGDSGSGKNHIIEKVIAPIVNYGRADAGVCVYSSSEIDPNSDIPLIEQMLGYRTFGGGNVKNTQLSMSRVTESLRDGCRLLVLDEFDKVIMKDGRTALEHLAEGLRTILDRGEVTLPGVGEVSFKNVVICITTNLFNECLQNVDNFKKLDPTKLENPTGSRTYVPLDRSLMNRTNLMKLIMEPLKSEDFLALCQKKLFDMMMGFKKKYGVHLFYGGNFEKICEATAKEAEKRNEGARGVDNVINEKVVPQVLHKAILPFINDVTDKNSEENFSGEVQQKVRINRNFILSYDPETSTFDCSLYKVRDGLIVPIEVDEEGRVLPPDPSKIIRLPRENNSDKPKEGIEKSKSDSNSSVSTPNPPNKENKSSKDSNKNNEKSSSERSGVKSSAGVSESKSKNDKPKKIK